MGLTALIYYEEKTIYKCSCQAHLARIENLESKQYSGESGKAYLFTNVINIFTGSLEDRRMRSGLHTVCDVYCNFCLKKLGWKYERAYDEQNKFKEGKYILERAYIKRCSD